MPKKDCKRSGVRAKETKKKGKLHSVKSKPEAITTLGNLENNDEEDKLYTVPKGPFKIFPRAYYKCALNEEGKVICWQK